MKAIDIAAQTLVIINAHSLGNKDPLGIMDEEKQEGGNPIQRQEAFRLAPALLIAILISIVVIMFDMCVENEGLPPLAIKLKTIATLMSYFIITWVNWKHFVYSYRKWRGERARARLVRILFREPDLI